MRPQWLVLVAFLCAALAIALGCSKPADEAPAPTGTPVAKAPPTSPPVVESAEPVAKVESGESAESAAKPPTPPAPLSDYAWTETPLLSNIPVGPVKGAVNGKLFEPKSVVMDVRLGKVNTIVFSDKALESDSDLLTGDTEVVVTTVADLAKDYTMETGMGFPQDEGTIFYDYPGDNGPSTVNCPWACALIIDAFDKKPFDTAGPSVQVAGTCKGKIHLCFNDDEKSYIAGEFEAKIRYFGKP